MTAHDTVHPNLSPINDLLKLFSSPPLPIHASSHVLLHRRETWSVGDSEDTQLFGLGTPPVPEFRGASHWEGFPAGGGESTKPKMEGSWM